MKLTYLLTSYKEASTDQKNGGQNVKQKYRRPREIVGEYYEAEKSSERLVSPVQVVSDYLLCSSASHVEEKVDQTCQTHGGLSPRTQSRAQQSITTEANNNNGHFIVYIVLLSSGLSPPASPGPGASFAKQLLSCAFMFDTANNPPAPPPV